MKFGADEVRAEANRNQNCMRGWMLEAFADMLAAPTTWRPIETAPKDGTEILGWRSDCGVLLVRWVCPADFCTDREIEEMGADSAEQDDWFCADFICGGRMEGDEAPTHWMPLPLPPNAAVKPRSEAESA